ncbi:hypothetical protein ScoT_32470 [Streptomyces albidoflavus]|uniref:Uncharacterized protein n=1 Tax=Streptomyces albidoflavus TaxID=1886 RepID=A0AA37FFM4_9ACTN|nr:hypothetical protein ScoT_32470 [Streptomyces albidoflavus]
MDQDDGGPARVAQFRYPQLHAACVYRALTRAAQTPHDLYSVSLVRRDGWITHRGTDESGNQARPGQ